MWSKNEVKMVDLNLWRQLESAVDAVREGDARLLHRILEPVNSDRELFVKTYAYANGILASALLNDLFDEVPTREKVDEFARVWLPRWRRLFPTEDERFCDSLHLACGLATDDELKSDPPRLEHFLVALECAIKATGEPISHQFERVERALVEREAKYGPW